MKKVLTAAGCGVGVLAGGMLIWNIVLPFIGAMFQSFVHQVTALF